MSRLAALNQNVTCLAHQIKEARRFRKVKKRPWNFRKKSWPLVSKEPWLIKPYWFHATYSRTPRHLVTEISKLNISKKNLIDLKKYNNQKNVPYNRKSLPQRSCYNGR